MRSLARTVTGPGSGPGFPSPDRGVWSSILKLQGPGSGLVKKACSLVLARNLPVVP